MKRQLTISRYDVYKDSGIEWLGEVPAHWEVKRVKEVGNLVLGKMLDNVASENTFYRSYLKSKNIGWLKVEDTNIEKMYFSLAEMKKYRLKKYDILLSEGGEVGKTSFWNDEIEECYIHVEANTEFTIVSVDGFQSVCKVLLDRAIF